MTARCEFYDLPAESCAHCTGRTGEPEPIDLGPIQTFTARYAGRCAACDGRFESGDLIGRTTDSDYVCGECVR